MKIDRRNHYRDRAEWHGNVAKYHLRAIEVDVANGNGASDWDAQQADLEAQDAWHFAQLALDAEIVDIEHPPIDEEIARFEGEGGLCL